jgi:hypothetical protein
MRSTRLARAVVAAVLGLPLAGCAGLLHALPEMDWNPLVRVEHVDGATEVEALGPFVDLRAGPEGFSHALRPLYQHKANHGASATDWLAPLGRRFTTRSGTKWRFWPFVWAGETTDTPAGTDWQAVIFPIVFTGNGPKDDDGYFAIFPLAGRTRGLMGIDTFDFFLWPLFMRTRMNVTETSTSWTVLLLGGWTTGGPRDGSWRALPFWRHRIVRNADGSLRTDQHTFLWPFFTWGDDDLDTQAPSERLAIWPLWSRESSETWSRTTWLWPFFRMNEQKVPPVEEGGDYSYDLPWPFYRNARGEDGRSTFRIWPFYSHQTTPEVDSISFVWPLGWWREIDLRSLEDEWPPVDGRREDLYVIPFHHSSRRRLAGRAGADTEWQTWPLWHADHGAEGQEDYGTLSLVPARNIELLRPADELYSFLWTAWRHRSDGTRHETRLLFDTVMWRTGPEGTRVSVPFLYSQRPEPGGVAVRQVLWGLLGTRSDGFGLRSFSVLGFDLWSR